MEVSICVNGKEDSIHSEVGNYFFQSTELHDAFFIVGKYQERIPAVSSLLINQSHVWWSMLAKDSPLREKGDIILPDIEPDIFRLLLKHSYGGLEDCSGLPDADVVELCRCADKYLMSTLKSKIAASLKASNVDEVFHALHCIAHYNLQADNEAVRRIVQTQTLEIFAHPQFLECDEDSVTYITRQDCLGCEEVDLWQAVVKWAKNKAGTEDGPMLREWMVGPLQHIRLFTLSDSDLHQHVFPTNTLSGSEITSIYRKKSSDSTLCDNTETRQISTQPFTRSHNEALPLGTFKVDLKHELPVLGDGESSFAKSTSAYFFLEMEYIRLKYITCLGLPRNYQEYFYKGDYQKSVLQKKGSVNITVTVTRITDVLHNSIDEEPKVIKIPDFEYHYNYRFNVPLNILLRANNKYRFKLTFDREFLSLKNLFFVKGREFELGWINCSVSYPNNDGTTPCPTLLLEYNVDSNN